jgi:hypothetical protein
MIEPGLLTRALLLRLDVIDRCRHAALPGAVGTTEERPLGLDPVTDDLAPTVLAYGRQFVNGALETIEGMRVPGGNDLE